MSAKKHKGSWCSGITSALHAEGPGFKSRRIHDFFKLMCCEREKVFNNFYWAVVGIEPTTSPTLRENHTTRPNSHVQVRNLVYLFLLLHCSHSSVGQSVGLINLRSAVQARVGATSFFYSNCVVIVNQALITIKRRQDGRVV